MLIVFSGFAAVFEELGCSVEWILKEGDAIVPVVEVARVTGPVNRILLGERTALNIITRACGIATAAADVAKLAAAAGWHGEVAGTRKTTPGGCAVSLLSLLQCYNQLSTKQTAKSVLPSSVLAISLLP